MWDPKVVVDGVTEYLVPAGDPIEMAYRILEILGGEQLRVRMGLVGRKVTEHRFDIRGTGVACQYLYAALLLRRANDA